MPEFLREQAKRIETTYGSARSRGYDGDWVALRKEMLGRFPSCACGRPATIVHHVTPIKSGGARLDSANCETVCASCHQKRHRSKR
jgi:5-methylcytosine-specific restriction endonuclease McrA